MIGWIVALCLYLCGMLLVSAITVFYDNEETLFTKLITVILWPIGALMLGFAIFVMGERP